MIPELTVGQSALLTDVAICIDLRNWVTPANSGIQTA